MKNEVNADFKFLEIPNGEDVLGFLGSEWIREYGTERSHFHNLMEISICRWGFGNVILDKKKLSVQRRRCSGSSKELSS